MFRYFFFFLQIFPLFASFDYDCIVIGSSPFSLFEALYRANMGQKVLILEKESKCGGAWKSIDICGFSNVDLGCHQIGKSLELKEFIEKYAGCKIVSLDDPTQPFDPDKGENGWYFSQGCYELIHNLLSLVAEAGIDLLNHTKMTECLISHSRDFVIVKTAHRSFTAKRLIVTGRSSLIINKIDCTQYEKSKRSFLYLLIQDSTSASFAYRVGKDNHGISRIMNLTPFVGLTGSGQKLIVIQFSDKHQPEKPDSYLMYLKTKNLIAQEATILKTEIYEYAADVLPEWAIPQLNAGDCIEYLNTFQFVDLLDHTERWKQALKPF